MVRHARSKQTLVALCLTALSAAVASCGQNGNSPVGPQVTGTTPGLSPADGATAEALSNGVITQLLPLFYPDGTKVESVNGEPADAVLNRFAGQPKQRIGWGVMTQHLTPGETYDMWLEGSNDGIDSFNWWVGDAKATAKGDLNVFGTVYAGTQPGPGVGVLTNPLARANLVIKTRSGVTKQTAYFPAP